MPPSPPISVGSNTTDSPGPASKMLGTRTTPDSAREKEQQLCLPTHQVFDFPEVQIVSSPSPSVSPPPTKPSQPSISIDTEVLTEGLSSLPVAGPSKRPRTGGERITTKDFVPPDVSGLSKREARLVKNRAAAFLSRQRKREEFEAMEIRVKELEEDNARLQGAVKRGHDELLSEIDQLRIRLSASEKRGRELKAELSRRSMSDVHVKTEGYEHCLTPVSPSASLPTHSHQRSGASLGLMQVLLCTLPSLLSMSPRSLPTTYFIPLSDPSVLHPSCNFDYSSIIPSEFEWAPHPDGGAVMNLGFGDLAKLSSSAGSSSPRKLEIHSEAIRALGGFEISFDASPVNDGLIQVRIHPSQSHNINSNRDAQRAPPSSVPMWFESAPNNYGPAFSAALSFTASSAPTSSFVPLTSDFDLDPFLSGVHDAGMPYGSCGPTFGHHSSDATFEHIPGFMSGTRNDFSKHRARVTMRNLSTIGMEGEWEVPAC